MNFQSILASLQNLLANKQGQQNQEFGSNLGLQQSELGQQGSEFGQTLALQTKAQQEANALAQAQQQQSAQEQQFQQGQQAKTSSYPYLQALAMLNPAYIQTQQNNPLTKPTVGLPSKPIVPGNPYAGMTGTNFTLDTNRIY